MQRSKSGGAAAASASDDDHRIAIAVGDLNPCGIGLDTCVGGLLFASQAHSPPYPPQMMMMMMMLCIRWWIDWLMLQK